MPLHHQDILKLTSFVKGIYCIFSRIKYLEESSLYWHLDNSNKFIVKRNRGSNKIPAETSEETPLVKVVRYDPKEDLPHKLAHQKNSKNVIRR